MNKVTHTKELVRMWNDYQGYYDCDGGKSKSKCEECPLYVEEYNNCSLPNDLNPHERTKITEIFDVYDIIEMWSKKYQKEEK